MNTSSNLKAYSPFLPIEREEPQTPILLSDLLFLYLELKGKFRRFKEKVKKQEECHQRAHGNETRLLNDIKDWEENSRRKDDEIADLRHELEVANTGFLSSTPEVKERDEIIKEKIQIIEDQKKMIERDTKTIEFHRNRLQWITLAISKVNTGLWYWDEGSGYTRIYSKDGKDILNSV